MQLLEMGEPSESDKLREQIEELEEELAIQKARVAELVSKGSAERRALARLRSQLQPLFTALKGVFGELDAAGVAAEMPATSDSGQPIPSSRYDAWKSRLPDTCGKIIDALLVQPLTRTQLKGFCKLAYSTVAGGVKILQNNGLIEEVGDKIRLRSL